ncbi:hypothetical protein FACS1894141_5180 [Spirochaetia bacterium]|nr:hypothetical protein FACS1894141_5180 [Spirochaetia bacterium]
MVVSWLRLDANLLGLEPLGGDIANEAYYDIWRALQSIQNMDLSVRDMDMMVYYRNSDLTLSPSFMAGYMKDFYGSLNQFGSYSYDFRRPIFRSSSKKPRGRIFLPF